MSACGHSGDAPSGAPLAVRTWASEVPEWLEVRKPLIDDPSLAALGDGEREAICLTIELAADLLLIDERAGDCKLFNVV